MAYFTPLEFGNKMNILECLGVNLMDTPEDSEQLDESNDGYDGTITWKSPFNHPNNKISP